MLSKLRKNRHLGFTMIELLMVILLIGVLGAVALPQFLDFRSNSKAAAAKELETALNVGIKLQKTQAILRCGANIDNAIIPLDSLVANDITSGTSPLCTTNQVPNPLERRFLEQNSFPANVYNGLSNITDCVNSTYVGYCYNAALGIVAMPLSTSHTNTCTDCFQVANGVGTSTLGCTGSGCVQICNGITGDCTIGCPGGYCNQTCNGISGACNITCEGGNCNQICNGAGSCSVSCAGGDCT